MKKLRNFIVRVVLTIIFTALLLWSVDKYSEGRFWVTSSKYDIYLTFGFLAVAFFVCNTILKKILKVVTLPLRVLTLWLFSLVLNMAILYIFKYVVNMGDFGMEVHLWDRVQVFILSFLLMIPHLLAKLFK